MDSQTPAETCSAGTLDSGHLSGKELDRGPTLLDDRPVACLRDSRDKSNSSLCEHVSVPIYVSPGKGRAAN